MHRRELLQAYALLLITLVSAAGCGYRVSSYQGPGAMVEAKDRDAEYRYWLTLPTADLAATPRLIYTLGCLPKEDAALLLKLPDIKNVAVLREQEVVVRIVITGPNGHVVADESKRLEPEFGGARELCWGRDDAGIVTGHNESGADIARLTLAYSLTDIAIRSSGEYTYRVFFSSAAPLPHAVEVQLVLALKSKRWPSGFLSGLRYL